MDIDFPRIEDIFRSAESRSLLEHEVYTLLIGLGLETPVFRFIPRGSDIGAEDLADFPAKELVVKIVSPQIVHKSDVGGVRVAACDPAAVQDVVKSMYAEVPGRYQTWLRAFGGENDPHGSSKIETSPDIKGVLLIEAVDYDSGEGFASELMLGLRNSREFGPIVTLGPGGMDVEFLTERLRDGKALAVSAAHMMETADAVETLRPLAVSEKITRTFRGRAPLIAEETLADIYRRFLLLGAHFSPYAHEREFVIEEAEINPLVISRGRLVALDGLCRFSTCHEPRHERPVDNIAYLLEPRSIGIIGVSEKANIGRTILDNILKQGFPRDRVMIVKPGVETIAGCRCVPNVAALPETVDLFVLTVSAEQGYQVMQDIIREEKARSVIIIAGGIGEKAGTQHIEENIRDILRRNREQGRFAPVVNGGNCLGIFSRPGRYDTTFVPDYKIYRLPRGEARPSPLVFLSQSGAFMISRMSQMPGLQPLLAVSIGNQIDLTISDYLRFLETDERARIFGLYIEGFLPEGGLALAEAARRITAQSGKAVVVYKAGRTPEGRTATQGHTASVAGDYAVAAAVLRQAGAIMTETIDEFENTVKCLCLLADKRAKGRRVGLISNAGFECVIMSDSLCGECGLELASFQPETIAHLTEIMQPLGIDRLQDIRNPVDATPVADDRTFCDCVEAVLADGNVDCAVVSPLPMTPAMQTLAPAEAHREDLYRAGSTPMRLVEIFHRTDKPFVVSVDSGEIYFPMKELLEKEGVPVLSRCDEAVRFLGRYVHRFL